MEPSDFKAVRATVRNAGRFARPLAMCLRIYCSFMYAICLHLYVCERERRGGLLMIISKFMCVCV